MLKQRDFEIQHSLSFKVSFESLKDLTLGFILLSEDLVEGLMLEFQNFKIILKKIPIVIGEITQLDLTNKIFKGELSPQYLGYIYCFLLKYYRDGVGAAEHIDIDFKNGKSEVTMTIHCDSFYEYYKGERRTVQS